MKYLVSIISIFAALNHKCLVNISILFTLMFLEIRILFHNIPISFTFMFHDIRIQIIFTRWICGWRQGYAQSIYLDALKTPLFPMKLLAHINFFWALFLPFVRWNKTPINYKVLLNWLANQKKQDSINHRRNTKDYFILTTDPKLHRVPSIKQKLFCNFPETEAKF